MDVPKDVQRLDPLKFMDIVLYKRDYNEGLYDKGGSYKNMDQTNQMKISDWLDKKAAEGIDVSQIVLPDALSYDEAPSETVYFKEKRPCSILCTGNHPFSTVERFGHWYYSRGQDKQAGIHSSAMKWWLFTKNKDLAVRTAKSHIE
jgi:hypothetical protein